jgi:hypothetical protein
MSSTTGEHINELEERRQRRRQRRNAAQPGETKPPRSANTAPEARDLLRDLITNGSPPDEGAKAPLHAGSLRATDGSGNGSVATEGKRQPAARRNGEGVDELVRRVQAGAHAATDEAERGPRRGRPIGTADLSADAATRNPARRRAGRRAVKATLRAVEAKQRAPWAAAAAIVLIGGVVLALSLDSAGGRRPATTASAPIFATAAGPASAMRTTISTVDRELEALAHRPTDQVHPGRRVIKRARVRPRQRHTRTTQATSATQTQPVHVASPPANTTQTPTSTQQPPASPGRPSAGGASSSSGSAQPAGPTNASPLGGLGSCVSGCT